jgi:Transposase DDE domain
MIRHPSLPVLSGTFRREDLFLVVYCIVADWMSARFGGPNAPRARRGPGKAEFADAEVLTVLLVGELCHCQRERAWLRQVRSSYHTLFPALPTDGQFSRRAQAVQGLLRDLRRTILFWADADLEPLRLLDSFPLPLCACYRISQSTLPVSGATFGYNASKKQFYHGLHPQLMITGSGFIDDLIPAPGNCNDTPALAFYLDECVELGRELAGQTWVLDNGYSNPRLAAWAQERLGLTLLVRQRDRPGELPSFWQHTLDQVRKPIEGVIATLTQCLGIERLLARTDYGLYRRLQAKATAFSLARYFNRALGLEAMDIARYAV